MTTPNGSLPDFILSPDEAGIWRIAATGHSVSDRHGNLFAGGNRYLRGRALLSLLQEAGANYKIINPKRHIEKK